MVGFRNKRRRDGRPYTHPIVSPGESAIEKQIRSEELPVHGHPHPGEALEHAQITAGTPAAVTPISITVQSGGPGGNQTPPPAPPREPIIASPVISPVKKSVEYPSATLNGEWDVVEPELYKMFNVVDVKKSFARGRATVEMSDGTKLVYHKKKDHAGGVHWTRREKDIIKPADEEDDENSDEDSTSSEGGFWD
jgi:hypothetical protein